MKSLLRLPRADSGGCRALTRRGPAATKVVFLAFSLRPLRLRGESAVPHSPPKRKERKESANKNSFQAAKDFRVSNTERPSGWPVQFVIYHFPFVICHFQKCLALPRPGDPLQAR